MHDPDTQDTEDLQPSSPLARAALDYAAGVLEGDTTGHDMRHVDRVVRTAQRLAEAEGAEVETIELIAAERHDYMVAFLERFHTESSGGDGGLGPSCGGRGVGR